MQNIFAPNGLVSLWYRDHKTDGSLSGVPYAPYLTKRTIGLDPDDRLLSQVFQHQSDHNNIDHGFAGFAELFIIFARRRE